MTGAVPARCAESTERELGVCPLQAQTLLLLLGRAAEQSPSSSSSSSSGTNGSELQPRSVSRLSLALGSHSRAGFHWCSTDSPDSFIIFLAFEVEIYERDVFGRFYDCAGLGALNERRAWWKVCDGEAASPVCCFSEHVRYECIVKETCFFFWGGGGILSSGCQKGAR